MVSVWLASKDEDWGIELSCQNPMLESHKLRCSYGGCMKKSHSCFLCSC